MRTASRRSGQLTRADLVLRTLGATLDLLTLWALPGFLAKPQGLMNAPDNRQ